MKRFTYEIEVDHNAPFNLFKYDVYLLDTATDYRDFIGCYLTYAGAENAARRDARKRRKGREVLARFSL